MSKRCEAPVRPARAGIAFVLAGYCAASSAGLLPDSEREQLLARALHDFWIQARDERGMLLTPASEAERHTVPVSRALVERAFDAGEASGLGQWCGLDWRGNQDALTEAVRRQGYADKQIVFLSFLHRAAQSRIASAMAKAYTCEASDRTTVLKMLDRSRSNTLKAIFY